MPVRRGAYVSTYPDFGAHDGPQHGEVAELEAVHRRGVRQGAIHVGEHRLLWT